MLSKSSQQLNLVQELQAVTKERLTLSIPNESLDPLPVVAAKAAIRIQTLDDWLSRAEAKLKVWLVDPKAPVSLIDVPIWLKALGDEPMP